MGIIPEDTVIRFSMNGPIRTNLFLDPRKLIDPETRERLLPNLERNLPQNGKWRWDCCLGEQRESGLDRATDTRRGTTIKPPYVVEALVEDGGCLKEIEHGLLAGTGKRGAEFAGMFRDVSLQSVAVRFFDFGYATFLANFDLHRNPGANLTLDNLREGVEILADGINAVWPTFECMIGQLEEASGEDLIKQRTSDKIRVKSAGVAWVHRVFGLQFSDAGRLAEACGEVGDLILTSSQESLDSEKESMQENSHIYVSTGNSAALFCGAAGENPWEFFSTLSEMIQMQNAFFAAAEDLEDDLFLMTSDVSLNKDMITENSRVHRVEKKAIDGFSRSIVVLLEEGILFKSAFLDYGNHLNPQEATIWKRIQKRWGTKEKFDHIDEKSDALRVIYDRIITIIDQDKAQFLNRFALWFTLAGGVSAMIDVVSFIFNFRWPSAVPILVIFGILAIWTLRRS